MAFSWFGRKLVGAALVFAAAAFASGSAQAETIVEDFGRPSEPGFDGFFLHSLINPPPANAFWEFTDQQSLASPGNYELFLAPATDNIRFATSPSQFVDFAAVTVTDYCGLGCTSVTFVGAAGTKEFKNSAVGVSQIFDTIGLNLGAINQIVLTSAEGAFDNLTVNVVPEPSTFLLAVLAAAAGLLSARHAILAR
jgi:hypothetical protein